ncbi:hypothetical protein B0T25DRAFT_596166 [Lasiosphaeria hispida]|uniref:T6SS Phospholipase effector Tle1-like catalytic domain-containing protein n=1 Tax=Lasiosphaeria hispida TaxID=260671 RepID=A0AAJ0HUI8_9PEZI|nr:hypothetical protein B0T25DRAFT_596166 [Lasiosphaeria hispida]
MTVKPFTCAHKSEHFLNSKRLVICCDGTWNNTNDLGFGPATNVSRLSGAVAHKCCSGMPQLVYYHPGAGTESSKNTMSLCCRHKIGTNKDGDKYEYRPLEGSVKAVGVWDTVGSLGMPKIPPFYHNGRGDSEIRFESLDVHPNGEHAFHAIALDEWRTAFNCTVWGMGFIKNPDGATPYPDWLWSSLSAPAKKAFGQSTDYVTRTPGNYLADGEPKISLVEPNEWVHPCVRLRYLCDGPEVDDLDGGVSVEARTGA